MKNTIRIVPFYKTRKNNNCIGGCHVNGGRFSVISVRMFLLWLILLCSISSYSSLAAAAEVELPPMIDSDDISYFFGNNYDIDGLHWALTSIFANRVRSEVGTIPIPESIVSKGGGDFYTTTYKLQTDLEQAEYLVESGLLKYQAIPPSLMTTTSSRMTTLHDYYVSTVIPGLKTMISRIPPLEKLTETHGLYPFSKLDYEAVPSFAQFYNKALYVPEYPQYQQHQHHILNPYLDLHDIQKQWDENRGIAVVDHIFSEETLNTVRNLLLESTVWYQTKMPKRFGGYVGAYIDDGLHAKILLEISKEIHRLFPSSIMKNHPLKYLWAYKYDSNYSGIHTHADQAAVNINIWLTPDEANLDKESGGLVIFTKRPPKDWDFQSYNTNKDMIEREILIPSNYANITVPFRYNRAVIFDSALFHHSDSFHFQQGYTNRRINLTLLYGTMQLDEKNDSSPTKEEL